MVDEKELLLSVLTRSDWWVRKPKPKYVPRRLVLQTKDVQLMGFTSGRPRGDILPFSERIADVLQLSPGQVNHLEYIHIAGKDLTGKTAKWIEHMRDVRYVHFRECRINSDTIAALQLATEVGSLTLHTCELKDPEALAGLPNVRVIQLVDTEVPAGTLTEVRKHLPDTIVQSFHLDGNKLTSLLPPAEPIHRPDTRALKRIRDAFKRMSTRMTEIGSPPNPNTKGWDSDDTAKVEQQIGFRLPKDLRFALDQNTGQFDGVVCLCPFQQPRGVVPRTHFQQTSHWRQPHWFSLRDSRGRWHYPLVTFMGEDANNICLNLATGEVVFRGDDESVVLAPNLGAFF